jgi:DNA modification methylase
MTITRKTFFTNAVISNPKLKQKFSSKFDSSLFPYYAGYSDCFAHDLIQSLNLERESLIYDPWNGSGTTTTAAARLGFSAVGCDLNPVMILVAKARILPHTPPMSN